MYGHKRVRERRNDALTRVGWEQLELLLATWYRGQGYDVEHSGTGASGSKYDGGIDLKLRRPGEYVLVQVKHWNVDQVPHNEVHQLLGLMINECATGAILITSGEFTNAAIEAATRHGHVRLVDGNELRAMLGPLPEPAPIQAGRSSRRAAENGVGLLLVKGAFALVAILFVVVALNRALHSVTASLQHRAQAASPSTRASVDPVPRTASRPNLTSDSCDEVIDQPSGTYIDHCAPVVRPRTPTAAEIRESKRKADEAIRVLAPNTPSM